MRRLLPPTIVFVALLLTPLRAWPQSQLLQSSRSEGVAVPAGQQFHRLPTPPPPHDSGSCPPQLVSGTRANSEVASENWMAPYLQRVANGSGALPLSSPEPLPPGFQPWWAMLVPQRLSPEEGVSVGVDWLIQSALLHSSHVQAVVIEPQIRRTELVEEQAEFDWKAFLNTKYDDLNDPVGNTLTTGNNSTRFVDRKWNSDGGFKRQNLGGGNLSVLQRIGHQQNNSRFLVPNPQSTTRLELAYTQPLLNGAGRPYNESRIVIAAIDLQSSEDDVVVELQDHLLQVTETYWDLYRARAECLQQQRVLHEAETILADLMGRQEVDSLERQVLRAKAAVANRSSKMARAMTSIRNASAQLRLLVNDPVLLQTATIEITPRDEPAINAMLVSMHDGLHTALLNRPDISHAIRDMRTTTTRLGVAKNEILPKLDFLVSTYVAGLAGDSRVFDSLGNQFTQGRPGYTVGLQFEVPLGNRAAQARLERQNLELARATSQFRAVVEKSLTETEIAIREVDTTYREMVGKFAAMRAAENETRFLVDRWRTLPGLDDSATLLLEDLLDSQERRADEEAEFVRAQVNYSVSLVRLRKALGTLLRCEPTGSSSEGMSQPDGSLNPLPPPDSASTARSHSTPIQR